MSEVEWRCPACEAPANKHGKMPMAICKRSSSCMGFICECEDDTGEGHGESLDERCPNATCYHCGWGGTFPPQPMKLTGWEKKAWDAGWRPPAGWLVKKEQS